MKHVGLDELIERKRGGERGLDGLIVERIAEEVYRRPRLYGFRSEDDVGEVFVRYWTRIGGLAERYQEMGHGFESFLVSSLRYMALSMRRQHACLNDKEGAIVEDAKAEARDALRSPRALPEGRLYGDDLTWLPSSEDHGVPARAFRRRVAFLCVKCAHVLGDDEAVTIARTVGLDERGLLQRIELARSTGLGLRKRTASRRRGRDAAWIRMSAASRRLERETDADTRRYLAETVSRNRGLYVRAIARLAASKPLLSNKAVAYVFGIPKGTVDCGLRRLMKQCEPLYSDDYRR